MHIVCIHVLGYPNADEIPAEENEESLQSPSSSKYTFGIVLYFELQLTSKSY